MSDERLRIISSLIVTLVLIAFAAFLSRFVPGPTADNLSIVITTAVIARWLQQGAQQTADKAAEKLQEAVETVRPK